MTKDNEMDFNIAMNVVTGGTRRARSIREARGLSLSEVARATNVLPDRLSRFERFERLLRYDALARLSRFYKVPIDELLKEEPREAPVG